MKYDITIEGKEYKEVPFAYMRPDTVLANGKNVGKKNAGDVLKGRKFRIPTYQRRYAWKEDNWKNQWRDLAKKDHRMGLLAVYEDGGDHIVVDGQ